MLSFLKLYYSQGDDKIELGEKEKQKTETLHIPALRRKWQILALQILSTASLLLLLKRMNEIYGICSDNNSETWCPSYEHTRGLMWLESNEGGLLIPDFLLGVNQTGTLSLLGPLLLCIAGTIAFERFWSSSLELQTRIKQGIAAVFGLWIIVPFILSWIIATFRHGLHFPWNGNDSMNHISDLFSPLGLVLEIVFLGIVFAPILVGLVGIWGLSKRAITWSVSN